MKGSAPLVRQSIVLLTGDQLVIPEVIRAIECGVKARYKHISLYSIIKDVYSFFTFSALIKRFLHLKHFQKSQGEGEISDRAKQLLQDGPYAPVDFLISLLVERIGNEFQRLLIGDPMVSHYYSIVIPLFLMEIISNHSISSLHQVKYKLKKNPSRTMNPSKVVSSHLS